MKTTPLMKTVRKVFGNLNLIKIPLLVFFGLSLLMLSFCSFFFYNEPDFMATTLSMNNTQIIYEVSPSERTINFTSNYRRIVNEAKYQTNLTGSSKIYYVARPEDDFKPIVLENSSVSLSTTIISTFDSSYHSAYFNFETIDGKHTDDFEKTTLNDVFITKAYANQMIEGGFSENYEGIVDKTFTFSMSYGDGVIHKHELKIIGILTEESISSMSKYEGDDFIYCLFGEIMQYRLTYASLRAIINTNEKAANRFLLSNFNKVVQSSEGKLVERFFESKNDEWVLGKYNSLYSRCVSYYSWEKEIIGAIFIIVLFAGSVTFFVLYFKNNRENIFFKGYKYLITGCTIVSLLAFLLASIIPPFFLGAIPICFLTPISSTTAFLYLIASICLFAMLKRYVLKEKVYISCTFANIDI